MNPGILEPFLPTNLEKNQNYERIHVEVKNNQDDVMEKFLSGIPWSLIMVACLTIGLAPFAPPHVWEKLRMLAKGRLVRPLDWFDLFMHGAPWVLLILKGIFSLKSYK